MQTKNSNRMFIQCSMDNYKMIDVVKYVAAIMVIIIHCSQIVSNEYLNFFIKNILCRVAVPFFFISSAYFVRRGKKQNEVYVKIYLKSLLKSYLLWSIVFIPIGLDWIHQNLNLANNLLPVVLLYGLLHIGTYYHLWYIPAMILSVFLLDYLLKHVSYRRLFLITCVMFMFGSLESYYGLLQNGWFKDAFDTLMSVISTTRSALLYGMIFTLMGFYIYDHQEKLKKGLNNIPVLTIISAILLIVEGTLLYRIERLDMNFLIMLIPFSFCFFLWVLAFPYIPKSNTKNIRELSKYYYFVHPISIIIVEQIAVGLHIDILSSGILSFLVVMAITHVLSRIIITAKKGIQMTYIVVAALSGALITCLFAGVFFLLKAKDIMIKFELVPCLWICFSIMTWGIIMNVYHKKYIES